MSADILIIDDTLENLRVLSNMLDERGYNTRPVTSGKMALKAALSAPPDLILLDISMPQMDGYEICRHFKKHKNLKDIPIIFISARTAMEDIVNAFKVGGVDYITKPFQFEETYARVETHLRVRRLQIELELYNEKLQELVSAQVKEISNSHLSTIVALAKLAESRDDDTGLHLDRVQTGCKIIAQRLKKKGGLPYVISDNFIDTITTACILHDIGKVAIPDAVLLKPGKLTPEEFECIKQHVIVGSDTLGAVRKSYPKNSLVNMGIDIARYHHEKWDGTGYPEGLQGTAIPLTARIMALIDVYDALRSERCYKPAFSHAKTCSIISEESGKHFDPEIAGIFNESAHEFASNWGQKKWKR